MNQALERYEEALPVAHAHTGVRESGLSSLPRTMQEKKESPGGTPSGVHVKLLSWNISAR